MAKIPSIEELIKCNAIPKDTKKVKDFKDLIISHSEYKELFEKGISVDKIPAVPNPVWVGQSKRKGYTYSCDSKGRIGRYGTTSKTFCIQELNNKTHKLSTSEFDNFKRKEDINMSDLNNANIEELLNGLDDAGLGDLPEVPTPGEVTSMDAFDNAPSMTGDEGKQAITEAITANISGVQLANANDLGLFNQRYGRMMAYITQNEPVVKFGISSKPRKDAEGNKILLSEAPDEIKAAFNNGDNRISSTYFEKDYSLTAKQAAPGKILGGVISIPEGGDVDILDLKGEGTVAYDKNKKDLVYKMLNKDELNLAIVSYFNGRIKESEETFGEFASKLDLQAKVYNKTGKDGETVKLVKQKLVPENRNKVIVPGAFFPIKTYETIDQNSPLTEEQCDILNKGAFLNLFQSKGDSVAKARKLVDVDRQKIKEENGKISSVFFTTNVSEKEQLEITPYWMKNGEGLLPVVEVPVKIEKPKKDGSGSRLVYQTYSSLDKQVMENPEYKAKTSLYSGKYERVLAACHGAITDESLRKLTARKKTAGSKKNDTLDLETTRKLLLQNSESGLSGLSVEGGKRVTIEDFREAMGQA